MSSVLIVGGSIAGLTSGLMLARAGHQVTVLERDAAAMPETIEDAANWMRPTVPQVQHAHGFGALTRAILARRLPDVLGDLLAFGAGEYHLRQWMPPTAAGAETITAARTDDLISLGCRRITFDWVLRQRALGQPGLTLRDGVLVTGLAWRSGPIRQVIGVTTREHGTIRADVVLDASGRRTQWARWARDARVAVDEWDEDCGFTGYTRFYRILDPAVMPRMMRGNLSVLIGDGFLGAAFLTDNRTVAVVLARLPQDATFPLCRARHNGKENPARKLTDDHHRFNAQVAAIRFVVEQAIAHIKNWRIMTTRYRGHLDRINNVILAAIGLQALNDQPSRPSDSSQIDTITLIHSPSARGSDAGPPLNSVAATSLSGAATHLFEIRLTSVPRWALFLRWQKRRVD